MPIRLPKKTKTKPPPRKVLYGGFEPGAPVDRLCTPDGKSVWVSGYKVFDPNEAESTIKGCTPIAVKTRTRPNPDEVLIQQIAGTWYRPIRVKSSHIRLADPATSKTFNEVFGVFQGTATLVKAVLEADEMALGADASEFA